MGITLHGDGSGLSQRDLAVQDGICHGISCLDHGIHRVQIRIQFIQICPDSIHVAVCRQHFHHLDVIAVIMPPAADLPIHVFHFLIVGLDQLPLISGNSLVNLSGNNGHGTPPYVRAMIARFSGS